uniref:CUB domain-containing protein n=1 Tax=Steinernema glaseri TaxID=37863 RepID=A0A1I7Z6U1_9BILA
MIQCSYFYGYSSILLFEQPQRSPTSYFYGYSSILLFDQPQRSPTRFALTIRRSTDTISMSTRMLEFQLQRTRSDGGV